MPATTAAPNSLTPLMSQEVEALRSSLAANESSIAKLEGLLREKSEEAVAASARLAEVTETVASLEAAAADKDSRLAELQQAVADAEVELQQAVAQVHEGFVRPIAGCCGDPLLDDRETHCWMIGRPIV